MSKAHAPRPLETSHSFELLQRVMADCTTEPLHGKLETLLGAAPAAYRLFSGKVVDSRIEVLGREGKGAFQLWTRSRSRRLGTHSHNKSGRWTERATTSATRPTSRGIVVWSQSEPPGPSCSVAARPLIAINTLTRTSSAQRLSGKQGRRHFPPIALREGYSSCPVYCSPRSRRVPA